VSLGSIELSIDSPPTSDVGAQSANQVLSDVLVDPPEVLSARRMCCQSAWPRTSALLGGLLIKLFRLFGQLDSEEGLHAGVEVESFTSPAGPDRFGVGVVEAVHRRQPIMLMRLLPAAQREVEVPGQVLVADPPITRLAIRFGEHPALRSLSDTDTTFVDGGVMPLTEQDQIANTALDVPSQASWIRASDPSRRSRFAYAPLPGTSMTPGATVSTSSPIVLAAGHITAADELSIQLVEPAASPSVIMIVWPAKETPVRPDMYADCAAKIMRVVARASIELARRRLG
jgi:hypothetical protein